MFEKFTEKAINVVTTAQREAQEMSHSSVQPEHLFLAITKLAKGISLKIFKMYNLSYKDLRKTVEEKLKFEKVENMKNMPAFSMTTKNLLKSTLDLAEKSNNQFVLYEHLFLAVLKEKNSYIGRILEHFNFDVYKASDLLNRLVQKKTKKLEHPEKFELTAEEQKYRSAGRLFDGDDASKVFKNAVDKLNHSKYEILGTDQIISAILDNKDSNITKILNANGINAENFEAELAKQTSRKAEYEGQQVVFTPNAFVTMNLALQTAKELGTSEVTAEHIILSMLKLKKGIAYDVFKNLNISDEKLRTDITKPIEQHMSESLAIMKFVKQETRRLGKNVVGSEMFLLGILSEGSSIAARVLSELEITMKDARATIESFVGYGNDFSDKDMTLTDNAKKVLNLAWTLAKKENKKRIEAQHFLLAITMIPDSVAMKALEHLGVDAVEIKQGILNKLQEINA